MTAIATIEIDTLSGSRRVTIASPDSQMMTPDAANNGSLAVAPGYFGVDTIGPYFDPLGADLAGMARVAYDSQVSFLALDSLPPVQFGVGEMLIDRPRPVTAVDHADRHRMFSQPPPISWRRTPRPRVLVSR
jgi:hypothetical protein